MQKYTLEDFNELQNQTVLWFLSFFDWLDERAYAIIPAMAWVIVVVLFLFVVELCRHKDIGLPRRGRSAMESHLREKIGEWITDHVEGAVERGEITWKEARKIYKDFNHQQQYTIHGTIPKRQLFARLKSAINYRLNNGDYKKPIPFPDSKSKKSKDVLARLKERNESPL